MNSREINKMNPGTTPYEIRSRLPHQKLPMNSRRAPFKVCIVPVTGCNEQNTNFAHTFHLAAKACTGLVAGSASFIP
jgi:hypothetical protein